MENKKIVTIYTLLVFLFIAAFGFLAIGVTNHNTHNLCPFTAGSSSPCPESNQVAATLHHVDFMESFSETTPSVSVASALLLFLTIIVYVFNLKDSKHNSNRLMYIKDYNELHKSIFISQIKTLNKIMRAKKINSLWFNHGAHYLIS